MTQTSPYGPPTLAAPPRPPVVVPIAPVRGWALADGPRRFAALTALPLAAVLCALSLGVGVGATGAVQTVWLVVGPATFYSLARVLRPEPRHLERTSRHLLASAATSFSVPVLVVLLLADDGGSFGGGSRNGDDVVTGLGSLAFVLGVITAVWGLVALVVRALRRSAAPGRPPATRP